MQLVPVCHPDRTYKAKGLCAPCYGRSRRKQRLVGERRWEREHAEKRKASKFNSRLKRYGLTAEELAKLESSQGGVCALCGRLPEGVFTTLAIDHDHATGEVRGLLCGPCNRGLGMFKDSIPVLTKAIAYLESPPFKCKTVPQPS